MLIHVDLLISFGWHKAKIETRPQRNKKTHKQWLAGKSSLLVFYHCSISSLSIFCVCLKRIHKHSHICNNGKAMFFVQVIETEFCVTVFNLLAIFCIVLFSWKEFRNAWKTVSHFTEVSHRPHYQKANSLLFITVSRHRSLMGIYNKQMMTILRATTDSTQTSSPDQPLYTDKTSWKG